MMFFTYCSAQNCCDSPIRGHPLSTYAKFSEKLTFLTPWYAHIRVPIRGLEMLVFRKILRTYLMDNPLWKLLKFLSALVSSYTLWKYQKTSSLERDFLRFSGGEKSARGMKSFSRCNNRFTQDLLNDISHDYYTFQMKCCISLRKCKDLNSVS